MLRERFNYIIKPAYEKIKELNKDKKEIHYKEEKTIINKEKMLAYKEELNYNSEKIKMAELEFEKLISNQKNKE